MSFCNAVFSPDSYNITLDEVLSPLANYWIGTTDQAEATRRRPIVLFNLKTWVFNIANVLLVAAVVFGLFLNPTAALVYGAIGLGARYIVQQDLETFGNTRSEIFEKFHINTERNLDWRPEKVVFCKQILWRNRLPNSL